MRPFLCPVLLLVAFTAAACGGAGSSGSPTQPSGATVNLTGAYRLTITPSAVCTTWPSSPESRLAWNADLTQNGTEVVANFPTDVYGSSVRGLLDGDTLDLAVYIAGKTGPCWLDVLAHGTGRVSGRRVTGTISGEVAASSDNDSAGRCTAANHTFVLEPR